MILDYFFLAFRSLVRRKLRSWLTAIGVIIGIIAVVALISIGQGMKIAINEEFESIGTNRIMITPGGVNFGPSSSSLVTAKLGDDDLKVVKSVSGVKYTLPIISSTSQVTFEDETKLVSVWGVETDSEGLNIMESISFLDIESGRQFKGSDYKKAIIGYNVAFDTYEDDIKKGDSISIEGVTFDIVGIQKKAGTGVHDVLIRIPMGDARVLFDEPEDISTIFVYTDLDADVDPIADELREELRDLRDVEIGEEDFQVSTAQQTIEQLNAILGVVQVVLVGIAAISLLVGGVGVMNTMYTSVLERRRDIGVMKSVGARNKDIFTLFFIESGMIGLVGGFVGLLIGFGISKLVEILAISAGADIFRSYFGLPLIIGAMAFSFLVGSISGTFPALQASKMNPVDALKK